jgi:hypothetical protein
MADSTALLFSKIVSNKSVFSASGTGYSVCVTVLAGADSPIFIETGLFNTLSANKRISDDIVAEKSKFWRCLGKYFKI